MEFVEAFRADAVPKLRGMIKSRGLFVALGLDRFSEAHAEIMHEACRLGATHLPPRELDRLLDWSATALLRATLAAEARHGLG